MRAQGSPGGSGGRRGAPTARDLPRWEPRVPAACGSPICTICRDLSRRRASLERDLARCLRSPPPPPPPLPAFQVPFGLGRGVRGASRRAPTRAHTLPQAPPFFPVFTPTSRRRPPPEGTGFTVSLRGTLCTVCKVRGTRYLEKSLDKRAGGRPLPQLSCRTGSRHPGARGASPHGLPGS